MAGQRRRGARRRGGTKPDNGGRQAGLEVNIHGLAGNRVNALPVSETGDWSADGAFACFPSCRLVLDFEGMVMTTPAVAGRVVREAVAGERYTLPVDGGGGGDKKYDGKEKQPQ